MVTLALAALVLTACGTAEAGDMRPGAHQSSDSRQAASPDGAETTESAPETEGDQATAPALDTDDPTPAESADGALSTDAIGGVRLPAHPAELLAAMEGLIGAPETDEGLPGCLDAPAGGVTRSLGWGDFLAYGTAATSDEVSITSWEVIGPNVPEELSLPAGLTIGSSTEQARAALPEADLIPEGASHGGPLLVAGDLGVKLDGTSGEVIGVYAHIGEVSCD